MAEPLNGKVVVRKDTTVSLECRANGNPAPTVQWVKLDNRKHFFSWLYLYCQNIAFIPFYTDLCAFSASFALSAHCSLSCTFSVELFRRYFFCKPP